MSWNLPSTSLPTASRVVTRNCSGLQRGIGARCFSDVRASSPGLRCSFGKRRGYRQVTRMGLFGLGLPEVVVIAGVAALVFGPSKLPELGKGLGKTMKSFQVAAKEFETELKTEVENDDSKAPKAEGDDKKTPPKAVEKEKETAEKKECKEGLHV
ncbi:hypothetical protein BSKO_04707 [Bryopsis sp. KO-2023]|nr:hypothetical protein BSKO_04707 [Bryopsis sp. KO-2023]